ncbi:hypothetical protein SAMN02745206_00348 [Desulfacinum infernum DSM 9756]|uniref:Uncharacterized protein n=1 Tax=Desulfacinum infernum DSM 9756 TaxID=1121391 RepID=A0A1M4TR42_9BACT|nr:hypothetical protein SAMN02745206_00348 [Desulfacinum infernum DSM 9756]
MKWQRSYHHWRVLTFGDASCLSAGSPYTFPLGRPSRYRKAALFVLWTVCRKRHIPIPDCVAHATVGFVDGPLPAHPTARQFVASHFKGDGRGTERAVVEQERSAGAAEAAKRVAGRSTATRPLPVHRASRSSHSAGSTSAQVVSLRRGGARGAMSVKNKAKPGRAGNRRGERTFAPTRPFEWNAETRPSAPAPEIWGCPPGPRQGLSVNFQAHHHSSGWASGGHPMHSVSILGSMA